jgi:hypothetical protein
VEILRGRYTVKIRLRYGLGTAQPEIRKGLGLTCPINYKEKYSPETRGRIKRVRYGLDEEEI